MTPEEQRIAIAEACGWIEIPWEALINPRIAIEKKQFCRDTGPYRCLWLTDYLNDLNAMHEAEKIKFFGSELVKAEWEHWLREVLAEGRPAFEVAGFELAHATAAQRAEALLRTLNLWKE
jgi:hypothetical protein